MGRKTASLFAALLMGSAALLAGCADSGGTGDGGAGGIPPSSTTPSDLGLRTDLHISIRADGSVESANYRLLCDGADPLPESQHPNAAKACALLEANPAMLDLPKPSATKACTMQYGGPAVAVVGGMLGGRTVNREFSLRDGCGISDWQGALVLLVDQPGLQ